MRRIIVYAFVGSFALVLAAHPGKADQPSCGDFQLISCVGDEVQSCATTTPFGARYVVTADDVANSRSAKTAQMCFDLLSSSLCGDTDAIATIARNGKPAYSRSIFDIKRFVRINAKAGDLIDISVTLRPIPDSPIICFRLGEVFFGLGRIP